MIARQPGQRGGLRRAQALPADPLAPDQRADVLVRHGRVADDGQDRVQQLLAVLTCLASFGQRVTHLAFGLALPRGDRLVEQLRHLVEHLDRRLRQQGEQDRIPALRVTALERLPGQPAADRGQKPASLRRQHRQV